MRLINLITKKLFPCQIDYFNNDLLIVFFWSFVFYNNGLMLWPDKGLSLPPNEWMKYNVEIWDKKLVATSHFRNYLFAIRFVIFNCILNCNLNRFRGIKIITIKCNVHVSMKLHNIDVSQLSDFLYIKL